MTATRATGTGIGNEPQIVAGQGEQPESSSGPERHEHTVNEASYQRKDGGASTQGPGAAAEANDSGQAGSVSEIDTEGEPDGEAVPVAGADSVESGTKEGLKGEGQGGVEERLEDLKAELQERTHERDEYLDALRRLQADFENYRKRIARHQAEVAERAAEQLVLELLPVLDALEMALVHSGSAGEVEDQGLGQVAAMLSELLVKQGLERLGTAGEPFDPTVHDAVAHVGVEDEPAAAGSGYVEEVLRPGYRWKGRLVRPAMVKVRG
ncbi:MAG: nucleotide exchange factor GrpE [Actinobacteria bacterium]|nr:nucleotide exchange factor GrpE [Actinomycetota bacterium]